MSFYISIWHVSNVLLLTVCKNRHYIMTLYTLLSILFFGIWNICCEGHFDLFCIALWHLDPTLGSHFMHLVTPWPLLNLLTKTLANQPPWGISSILHGSGHQGPPVGIYIKVPRMLGISSVKPIQNWNFENSPLFLLVLYDESAFRAYLSFQLKITIHVRDMISTRLSVIS